MAHRKPRLPCELFALHALSMATRSSSLPLEQAPPLNLARRASLVLLPLGFVVTMLPSVSASVALAAGILLALLLGNPWMATTRLLAHRSLAWSVMGLGAGMDLVVVGRVGLHGLVYTAVGIGCALALGAWLGRRLGVARDTSLLVSVGTAICGGSAIAAVAPTLDAKDHEVSVALVTIFLLNGVALMLFPSIGHWAHLSEDSFGLWCALAIHDTSSVVGAATQYGERALQVATAAKLARALWIIPVTFAIAMLRARASSAPQRASEARARGGRRPWFILGFLVAAAIVTFFPSLRPLGRWIAWGAHRLLSGTLFLIGLGLSRQALRDVGVRPLLQGLALWTSLATGTLALLVSGWLH